MAKHHSVFNGVLLVDKYKPKHFYEIIGLDYNNKNILKYISKWKDCIISKQELNEMKPLVFNGPPGTGKTTLAKLICQILNFEYLVINTSSEWNGQELIKKIENFLSRGKGIVSYNNKQRKCQETLRLVIMDEADGVVQTEKDSPINYLLDQLFIKKSNQFQWPIIFICNNLFVKGLKLLRENSEIFSFKRDIDSVKERMLDIIQQEQLKISQQNIELIVNHFSGDLRAILNFIQFHYKENGIDFSVLEKQVKIYNDSQQEYFDMMKYAFFDTKNKVRNVETNNFVDGVFENYLQIHNSQLTKDHLIIIQNLQQLSGKILISEQHVQVLQQRRLCLFLDKLKRQIKEFKINFFTESIQFNQKKKIKKEQFQEIKKQMGIYSNLEYLDCLAEFQNKILSIDSQTVNLKNKSFWSYLFLLALLDAKIISKKVFEYEEIEEAKIDKEVFKGFKKNDSNIEMFLQPNLNYFIQINQENQIQISKQLAHLIDVHLDFVKQEITKNPNLNPEQINFAIDQQAEEKSTFQFIKPKSLNNLNYKHIKPDGVEYRYQENQVQGVKYIVQRDFFFW